MRARSARRPLTLLPLLLVATLLLTNSPAPAAPAAPPAPTDDEGGTAALRADLDKANRGYSEAKARLAISRERQATMARHLRATEASAAQLTEDVNALAAAAYRGGRLNGWAAAFDSGSMVAFLQRAALVDHMSSRDKQRISALVKVRATLDEQKRQIDREVQVQQAQERAMAKRKGDAERALDTALREAARRAAARKAAIDPPRASNPSGTPKRANRSAPRRPDGSFPSEGCSLDDPTTGGCLTARMSNALQQARAAGFTRYTKCFRQASFGEHGKGRACDFSAARNTFGGAATGGDRVYGNNLSAWGIANADRIGVLYIIWYRRIWMPSTGWRAYSGSGSPASEHTNHVHISVE
jgi:peptidoglycan DL-endopeptidase CwlO